MEKVTKNNVDDLFQKAISELPFLYRYHNEIIGMMGLVFALLISQIPFSNYYALILIAVLLYAQDYLRTQTSEIARTLPAVREVEKIIIKSTKRKSSFLIEGYCIQIATEQNFFQRCITIAGFSSLIAVIINGCLFF